MRRVAIVGVCLLGSAFLQNCASFEGSEPPASGDCVARQSAALTACADHQVNLRGIDVSAWQADIDWAAVADADITFAFVRVSDGLSHPDEFFEVNWREARQAGLVRGTYQFFRPNADPIAQAELMLEKLALAGGLMDDDLPPVLDLEDDDGVSPADYQARALAWLEHVEQRTGRRPIVYSAAFFSPYLGTAFLDYPLWVANYKADHRDTCPSMPDGFGDWVFWQWSDRTSVPGASGPIDANLFDGDRAQLDAFIAASHVVSMGDAGAGPPASDGGAGLPDAGAGSGSPTEPGEAMGGAGNDCSDEEPHDAGDEMTMGTCGAPDVPSVLVPESTESYCKEGFVYDATYELCVSNGRALGPFSGALVDACTRCGGEACAETVWPVDQARALRGREECMPGTTREHGLCVDAEHAYGPFAPALVERCLEAGGGVAACESMRWDRSFAERLASSIVDEAARPWRYLMAVDHGIRSDGLGEGHFGAARSGNAGGHSGIDFLAPVGTPLLSPCDGEAVAGEASGYGRYVRLVCALPEPLFGGAAMWASLFYAHLSAQDVSEQSVVSGQQLGRVGKTGNAAAEGIHPHVHFEVAVHDSRAAAFSESHASSDHSDSAATAQFRAEFGRVCATPLGLQATTGPMSKGRRPDPFLLLTCLARGKPALSDPSTTLQRQTVAWSEHYEANIDLDAAR